MEEVLDLLCFGQSKVAEMDLSHGKIGVIDEVLVRQMFPFIRSGEVRTTCHAEPVAQF